MIVIPLAPEELANTCFRLFIFPVIPLLTFFSESLFLFSLPQYQFFACLSVEFEFVSRLIYNRATFQAIDACVLRYKFVVLFIVFPCEPLQFKQVHLV
jgi:hypothetical protein